MNLKEKIRSGKPTIGTWLTIPHTSVVEILATANFEWITIDIEHSAIDISTVQNLILAIQANNTKALVRVYANDEVIIKRVLDAGADGVIIPMIKTKEDVENAINHIYYPPKGKRGVGLNRAQGYGTGFDDYKTKLEKDIIFIAQIEHIDAINNLNDILAYDEIDASLIGPYDLSASIGYPGEYNLPEVKSALEKYDDICNALKKPKGAHVIESDSKFTEEKLEKGYSFLAYSLDFFFLGDSCRKGMSTLKKQLKDI